MDDKVLIKKVAIRNGIMSFYEKGNGFPIILIHGGISNSFVWKYQINELAKKYYVFSINRKYVNCNENTPIARYSLEENVDDLVALINVLGIKETYLVGHSYSGFMLLQLAKRNLPCIKAMIVAEPAIPQLLFNDKKRPGPIDIMRLIKTDRKALKSIIKFRNESIVPMDSAIKHGSKIRSIDLFLRGVEGQEITQFDDEIRQSVIPSA
jgi:Predicted hydrolases or acyltransferases (alpha/beta hydrolase superfamily)